MKIYWVSALIFFWSVCGFADDKIERMTAQEMATFTPDTVKWSDEPLLPKGAQSTILVGDPNKSGVFIAWLKFPPNYPIPPHTHPFTEVITVLRGKLGNGIGETFAAKAGEVLQAGSSFVLPAHHAHYVWTSEEETIIELIASGPWGITYINPSDDPRNAKQH